MPNWCMNEFKVSGNSDELKRFLDASMGFPAKYPPVYAPDGTLLFEEPKYTEKHFCFNALVPVPQEVLNVGFDGQGMKDENGKALMDGYHWCIANWGTKWDIYADNITLDNIGWFEGCESVLFWFDTAWAPPEEWLVAVSSMFPELSFFLHYEEPGAVFAGDIYGEEGEVSVDKYDGERLENCMEEYYDEEELE